jgi:hypothetical protein
MGPVVPWGLSKFQVPAVRENQAPGKSQYR